MDNKSVCAIVVTYNRKELLEKNILALINQSYKITKIIIIDNCSTDGTDMLIQGYVDKYDNIEYYKTEENLGGAGGFNYGLKIAYKTNCDYVWIMDDDTIPYEDSLDKLMLSSNLDIIKDWGFLCSNVMWNDNTACIMNVPKTDDIWNKYLINKLVKVKSTSFVSVLIRRNIIKEIGYPIKDFFIWGDDVEYTLRINKKYPGYLVLDSNVIHKMKNNNSTNILRENSERIDRYFYEYRNQFYLSKRNGKRNRITFIIETFKVLLKVISKKDPYKLRKLKVILRGFSSGIVFNPKIEYPEG